VDCCDHVDQISVVLADRDIPAIARIGVTRSAHEVEISRGILMRGDFRELDHLLGRFVTPDCTLVVRDVGYGYQRCAWPFWLNSYLGACAIVGPCEMFV
jgi:hypothetical protein